MTIPTGWPAPDARALSRSPLINVVWQARITNTPALSDGKTALDIRAKLGPETKLAPASATVSLQLVAGAGSQSVQPSSDPAGQAWRLSSNDGATHVLLSAGSISVETTAYGTWGSHMQPWITSTLNGVAAVAEPGLVLRVGMRYVNALFGAALNRDPFTSPADLKGVLVPYLLGFIAEEDYPADIEAFQGRHVLRFGDIVSHVQNGLATADTGEIGMLLDIDTYREQTIPFGAEDVLETSERLHRIGLGVFQHCVTPEALDAMGPIDQGAK